MTLTLPSFTSIAPNGHHAGHQQITFKILLIPIMIYLTIQSLSYSLFMNYVIKMFGTPQILPSIYRKSYRQFTTNLTVNYFGYIWFSAI